MIEETPSTQPEQNTNTVEASEPATSQVGTQQPESGKNDTAQSQPAPQKPTTNEERVWSLVAYLPFLSFVALVMKPDSEYVKLHGRQGMLLFLVFFFTIFVYIVPFIGPLIGGLVHLVVMVVAVFGMYQGFTGQWWKIPVAGDVAELLPVDSFTKVARETVMTEKVDKQKRDEAAEAEKTTETPPAETADHEEQQPSAE